MAKKNKIDGISLSIIILNILIVGVIITLCTLIYLYMTGQLEETDVSELGQEQVSVSAISTTNMTTAAPEEEETTSTEPEEDEDEGGLVVTVSSDEDDSLSEDDGTSEDAGLDEGEEEDSGIVEAVETDKYDEAFFAADMFIGDSIYTGLVNYGYFPESQVFAQIGLNPESARTKSYDGYTAVSKAAAAAPKRIFIMLGSNGLAYMGNTHMAEQMKLLTEELKASCPESYIYIVSIPPVTKEHDSQGQETMVMVNGYNKLLKQMAEEEGVVYLDLCSELEDNTGYFSDKYAEADGLHFLGSAYKKMLSFFQKSIQE